MFRKKQDVAERSRSLLKNSAAKKLKVEILAALPTLTKDCVDLLLPNKASAGGMYGTRCCSRLDCCTTAFPM